MIIIGEKINTSIRNVNNAVAELDTAFIQELALKQINAGANYIDVNCGTFVDEEEIKIEWLVDAIQSVCDAPLCIDSPNPNAILAAISKVHDCKNTIVNSITAEKQRWEGIMPIVSEHGTSVIALCMDDNGIPDSSDERLKIAHTISNNMAQKGVGLEKIYLDPMVKPVSVDSTNGITTLDTIRSIRKELPEVHITCGLSNVSFGLPSRKIINQAFLVASIIAGLDTAIINPFDKNLMSLIFASEVLAGKDEYCMKYIEKFREGYFDL